MLRRTNRQPPNPRDSEKTNDFCRKSLASSWKTLALDQNPLGVCEKLFVRCRRTNVFRQMLFRVRPKLLGIRQKSFVFRQNPLGLAQFPTGFRRFISGSRHSATGGIAFFSPSPTPQTSRLSSASPSHVAARHPSCSPAFGGRDDPCTIRTLKEKRRCATPEDVFGRGIVRAVC